MNFYKRYPGDYGKDTAHLSLMEHGAYTILLDTLYSTEKVLPKNPVGLFRVCRAFSNEEQDAVLSVVAQFFTEVDDGYTHSRVEEELNKADLLRTKARENGSKGGRPKKETQQKPNENQDKNPAGFETETESKPNKKAYQTPDTRHNNSSPKGSELGARKRATRLPATWTPSADNIDYCQEKRPDLDVNDVAENFRDYWLAKSGVSATKVDWDATWRSWVRNEKSSHSKPGPNRPGPRSGAEEWLAGKGGEL
jgi:uncharacterized protein YdaU (DUF1376 family)